MASLYFCSVSHPSLGAWIEIYRGLFKGVLFTTVVLFMGVWIEMPDEPQKSAKKPSHPSWVRGLKYYRSSVLGGSLFVAPFMGVELEFYSWGGLSLLIVPLNGLKS